MSTPSNLSKLSDTEKSIKDKQGPHNKEAEKSNNNKDSKEEKSDMQSEGGSC